MIILTVQLDTAPLERVHSKAATLTVDMDLVVDTDTPNPRAILMHTPILGEVDQATSSATSRAPSQAVLAPESLASATSAVESGTSTTITLIQPVDPEIHITPHPLRNPGNFSNHTNPPTQAAVQPSPTNHPRNMLKIQHTATIRHRVLMSGADMGSLPEVRAQMRVIRCRHRIRRGMRIHINNHRSRIGMISARIGQADMGSNNSHNQEGTGEGIKRHHSRVGGEE